MNISETLHKYLLELEKSRQRLERIEFAKNIMQSLFIHIASVTNSLRSGNTLFNPLYDKEFYYKLVDRAFITSENKPVGLGDFGSVVFKVLHARVIQEYEKENEHFDSIKYPENEAQADGSIERTVAEED